MKRKSIFIISTFLLMIITIGCYIIIRLNILPTKLLILFLLVVFLVMATLIYLLIKRKSKLSLVILLLLFFASLISMSYTSKLDSVLRKITDFNSEKQTVLVLVNSDESYYSIDDVVDLPFGANTTVDEESAIKVSEIIMSETDKKIHVQRFNDFVSLYESFFKSSPKVMLLKEDHMETMLEIDADFEDKVKIIAEYTYEVEIDQNIDTNTTTDTFNLYISGLDFAGDISGTQRSDANIVLTVNPLKNQILMTSIPRDTFVVRADNGEYDKLSLVGRSGMNNMVNTIENLLEIDIDYTLKVNWTSVVDVVDSLGGIEVDSIYAFKSHQYSFNKGINYLDGDKALSFVTNRMNLPDGDESRVYNQQIVLKAIINKMLSPSIITNYHGFLDAASDSVILNMPNEQLTNLIKSQLNSMEPWEIFSMQVIGDVFDTYETFSLFGLFQTVKEPRVELLKKAQDLIEMMENNEELTEEMFK